MKTKISASQAGTPAMTLKWWQTQRSRRVGAALGAAALVSLAVWFFFFRPYVSTDDARIDAVIVKLANRGASAQTEHIHVKEGDVVQKDQVLVELDRRVAEAQLEKAKGRADLAAAEYSRASTLARQGGATQQSLDRARAESVAASAELKLAQIAYDNTYLKSPVDGVVIRKYAEEGNILETNQTAVMIADIEHAWVAANIEETYVSDIKLRQKVYITVDEGGTLTGTVSEVRKAAASSFALIPSDNASGNFIKVVQRIPIRIQLDPHPNRTLRVGQSVVIKIRVK